VVPVVARDDQDRHAWSKGEANITGPGRLPPPFQLCEHDASTLPAMVRLDGPIASASTSSLDSLRRCTDPGSDREE
jgi:hypothetical protein